MLLFVTNTSRLPLELYQFGYIHPELPSYLCSSAFLVSRGLSQTYDLQTRGRLSFFTISHSLFGPGYKFLPEHADLPGAATRIIGRTIAVEEEDLEWVVSTMQQLQELRLTSNRSRNSSIPALSPVRNFDCDMMSDVVTVLQKGVCT